MIRYVNIQSPAHACRRLEFTAVTFWLQGEKFASKFVKDAHALAVELEQLRYAVGKPEIEKTMEGLVWGDDRQTYVCPGNGTSMVPDGSGTKFMHIADYDGAVMKHFLDERQKRLEAKGGGRERDIIVKAKNR